MLICANVGASNGAWGGEESAMLLLRALIKWFHADVVEKKASLILK